jgi:hypothetical protein
MISKKFVPILFLIPVLLLSGCTTTLEDQPSVRDRAKQFCYEAGHGSLEYSTYDVLFGESEYSHACVGVVNNTYVDWEIVFDDKTLRWYFAERGCNCEA